jgi:hypothetical protein
MEINEGDQKAAEFYKLLFQMEVVSNRMTMSRHRRVNTGSLPYRPLIGVLMQQALVTRSVEGL